MFKVAGQEWWRPYRCVTRPLHPRLPTVSVQSITNFALLRCAWITLNRVQNCPVAWTWSLHPPPAASCWFCSLHWAEFLRDSACTALRSGSFSIQACVHFGFVCAKQTCPLVLNPNCSLLLIQGCNLHNIGVFPSSCKASKLICGHMLIWFLSGNKAAVVLSIIIDIDGGSQWFCCCIQFEIRDLHRLQQTRFPIKILYIYNFLKTAPCLPGRVIPRDSWRGDIESPYHWCHQSNQRME